MYNGEILRLCNFYKHLWPNSHEQADHILNQILDINTEQEEGQGEQEQPRRILDLDRLGEIRRLGDLEESEEEEEEKEIEQSNSG